MDSVVPYMGNYGFPILLLKGEVVRSYRKEKCIYRAERQHGHLLGTDPAWYM